MDRHSFCNRGRSPAWLVACLMLAPVAAGAQPAPPFFENRPITFIVAFNPGGTYDTYARLAAKHLSKSIPGHPAIVVRNMQGANSARGATYLATQAPRDGTTIGMISQAIALKKVLQDPSVKMSVISTGSGASPRRLRPPSSGTPRPPRRSRMPCGAKPSWRGPGFSAHRTPIRA